MHANHEYTLQSRRNFLATSASGLGMDTAEAAAWVALARALMNLDEIVTRE